jgi:alpha-amylase/alpha-mannosidase (GH57 family)
MNIWHGTDDAPRVPLRVSPSHPVDLIIGTWPVAPGQSVRVSWASTDGAGKQASGVVAAGWERNHGVNSYWGARLGPFDDGQEVSYTIYGSDPDGDVQAGPFRLRVKPLLYVAWLWHHHQPLYRDPGAAGRRGSYRQPWVRLHALRDYYSMAAIAAEHDAHVTINLTPVLLDQIDDYLLGATDTALELTRRPAEELSEAEIETVLSTFFDADWHHQIYVHPRYRELFEMGTTGSRFDQQDVRDLQMWFNLAWFGREFRAGDVALVTGDVVSVHRYVRQDRGFSHADVMAMIDEQYKILRAIVPVHRTLQDAGRIEVSTSPAFHPILPLLINTDEAQLDRPGASLPSTYARPDDASAQIEMARCDYARRFAAIPRGMWPAEAAISAAAVSAIADHHFDWIASDAGVLERSGLWGYRAADPDVLCQPYRASDDLDALAIFFRDPLLSDAIGFRYANFADASSAAEDLIRTIETTFLQRFATDEDRVLTIALDGENAWGCYPDDGRPFLREIYGRLAADPRVKTVTFAEYLCGNPARGIPAHAPAGLQRVHRIATGSWIDEPGSAPGVDLGTWIGEPEENKAWELLGAARAVVDGAVHGGAARRARRALLAAEGSDWFWWLGSDQDSRNDPEFDELFRAHLSEVYRALHLEAPGALGQFIVARPVVWSFMHPIPVLRHSDQVSVRTHCPGQLWVQVDDGPEQAFTVVPVGGVIAGARRFQVTLGPFPAGARRVRLHFSCEHPGCAHDATCTLSGVHEIALERSAGGWGVDAVAAVSHE